MLEYDYTMITFFLGFLDLLSQLTVVGPVSKKAFHSEYPQAYADRTFFCNRIIYKSSQQIDKRKKL